MAKEELSSLFISVPERLGSFFSSISKEKLKSYSGNRQFVDPDLEGMYLPESESMTVD
ncbi:MAG: hypothetical protein ACOX69_09165 [Coriobacteriales bacterium]